jgi:hypothetical protein
MRSVWAVAAAVTMLLAFPIAIVASVFGENVPEIVVHIVLGIGMLLLAKAVFDFALPSWITWIGAIAAGALGAVFLLQAVSLLLPENAALDQIAFAVLGIWGERILIVGVDAWFIGLLLLGTSGRTRLLGWAIVPIVAAYHLISLVGAVLSVDVPNLRLAFFLPFVWLLFEGAKRAAPEGVGARPAEAEQLEAPAR